METREQERGSLSVGAGPTHHVRARGRHYGTRLLVPRYGINWHLSAQSARQEHGSLRELKTPGDSYARGTYASVHTHTNAQPAWHISSLVPIRMAVPTHGSTHGPHSPHREAVSESRVESLVGKQPRRCTDSPPCFRLASRGRVGGADECAVTGGVQSGAGAPQAVHGCSTTP